MAAFTALSDEIRIRLLLREINRAGHEGPAELGKVEALLQSIDQALSKGKSGAGHIRLKQTLAGAVILGLGIAAQPVVPARDAAARRRGVRSVHGVVTSRTRYCVLVLH